MNAPLTWVFSIVDRASAPAKGIAGALDRLAGKFHSSGDAAGGFMKHIQDLFFLKEAGRLVTYLAMKLHELGSEIVAGMAFKQNSLIALEALRGTREGAIEVFEQVEDFAWKTGQSIATVMTQTKGLLAAGFDPSEVRYLSQLIGDLNVIDPGKAQAAMEFIETAKRLGSGDMEGRMLHQLRGLVPLEAFSKQLGALAGVSTSFKDITERGAKADLVLSAFTNTLLKLYSKGVAGTNLQKVAESIPGLLERVKMLPERMLSTLVGFNGGAGSPFANILRNIAEAFDPAGASGGRIIDSLRGLIATIGGMLGLGGGPGGLLGDLAGPNGPVVIERIFLKLEKSIEGALPKVKAFYEVFRGLSIVVTAAADAINYIADTIMRLHYFTNPTAPGSPYAGKSETYRGGWWTPDMPAPRHAATNTTKIDATFNITGVSGESMDDLKRTVTEALTEALEKAGLQVGAPATEVP